ncbi:hypothetical protein NHH03_07045 [Stieleria sp. TO1_6]|uniref:hypothetical protein n=1 Tax=Stieleria tagensis TaxID=2956795 RepID=UPI00209B9258|nr:hypothetical protein [Stieleria tagensis]MCO8121487.1 hypothetical protein [Stieleria tagensis]
MEIESLHGREADSEPVLRSRLLPRVSFQSLLILTAVSAVVIAVVYAADQGGTYAAAAAVGVFFALAMLLLSAIVFSIVWAISFFPKPIGIALLIGSLLLLVSRVVGMPIGTFGFFQQSIWLVNLQLIGWFLLLVPIGRDQSSQTNSPFADGQLPPQIFAPREPTN